MPLVCFQGFYKLMKHGVMAVLIYPQGFNCTLLCLQMQETVDSHAYVCQCSLNLVRKHCSIVRITYADWNNTLIGAKVRDLR